jgi:EAL domain-containing protein (putative c-di-GMP-specific phosphodiesterase class I)/DNA-binding NarL/FixJ family response regulator
MRLGRPHVLCVDDEPQVLEGLRRVLGKRYDVMTAGSGEAGMAVIAQDSEISVIISDMRMPGMGGAEFLARAREALPDAQRIALTGHTELASAIAAVNQGQVFRFLTKPCPPRELLASVAEALERYYSRALEQSAARRAVWLQRPHEPAQSGADGSHSAREGALLEDLRKMIGRDGFELHYQPIVDLETLRVRGVEALARWFHPTLGAISPVEFVALAERSGEIVRLGQWIMRRACEDASRMARDGLLKVAVNVSPQELIVPEFVVDDFGTGYSSLAYLSQLPVDVIKVDKVFVQGFERGGRSIIKAALGIAQDFGREVIIEGVETDAMLRQVREMGASLAQGYLFAKPMGLRELRRWLHTSAGAGAMCGQTLPETAG